MKPLFLKALAVPLVVGAVAAQAFNGPVAAAEPYAAAVSEPSEPTGPGVTPPITWTQLGLSDRLDLIGSNQPVETSVPVPAGVGPTVLVGQIGSVVNVSNGRVDVLDGRGVALGSVVVPADLATVPFSVDLSAAQVTEGRATLRFVLRDSNPSITSCSQPPAVTLNQLSTSYSGPTPDPVTVADFLPGYLDQVVVRVGSRPTTSQQQAALDLVAELTHLYRPMPVRIDVATFDGPPPPVTFSRRVIDIRDGGKAGMVVENPGTPSAVLAITGTGDQLVRQVDMFADRRVALAQTATATVLDTQQAHAQSTNIKTFAQLGMTGQTSAQGTTTMYAGFDASVFGVGPITNAEVHVKATYTPVVGGEASVLIRSGSTVLATHRLDESGKLDVTGDIPAESISSNVGMAMEIRYVPRQECAPMNDRITFALDPSSTVTVTPGTRNRGGFPVLPMAFTPDFGVAIDSPDRIRFAGQAINLMGQQTGITLRPQITTFADGAASGTGLLVVTGGDELAKAGMKPPLLPGKSTSAGVNGSLATDIDVNGALGVVQAFTQNGRTVLAISGTEDWSLVDRSFDYVRGLPNRWASLTGDVVATGPAAQAVNLTIREGGGLMNEYPGDGWKWWAWLSLSLGVAAVIGVAATLVVRHRRVRR
jgi:hypothetical protein